MEMNRWMVVLGILVLAAPNLAWAACPEGSGSGRADAGSTFVRMGLTFPPEFAGAAWTADGSSMVVAGPDGWILRYYPGNRTFVNVSARGMPWAPDYLDVAVSPTTSEAIVVGQGGMAATVSPNNRVSVQPTGTFNDLLGVSYSSDGTTAYLAGANRTLVQFDAGTRKMTVLDDLLLPDLMEVPANATFKKVAFRPNGQYALLSALNIGRMYRLSDSSLLDITYKFTDLVEPTDIAWSPDGSRALVLSNSSSAFLWDGSSENAAVLNGPPSSRLILGSWRNDSSASLLSVGADPGLYEYFGLPAIGSGQPLEVSSFRAMNWRPDGKEGFIFGIQGPAPVVYHLYPDDLVPVLRLTAVTGTTASLSWSWNGTANGTAGMDHSSVYYSTIRPNLFDVTPVNVPSGRTCTLSQLQPATRYFAAVRVFFSTIPPVDAVSAVITIDTPEETVIPRPSMPALSDINATAVFLSWSWSPGASGEKLDHYLLLHSTSQADLLNATPLDASTNTTGRLYKLAPSTKYYLLIRVVTMTGKTADSDVQSFSTTTFSIPKPVSLELTGYRLQWHASSSQNISRYDLYYAQRPGLLVESMPLVTSRPSGQADYVYDLSSQLGTTFREGSVYYFKVRTVNKDGGTADSNEAVLNYNNPPSAVMAGKISDITYNSVRLSWGKSGASDFSAYIIESRQYVGGTWKTALKVSDRNTTSAVVGSLEPDTLYEFRIKVQDNGGKMSTTSAWAVHPRTDENIAYEIFATVFGDPAVCLPISFMMLFMTTAAAVGMRRTGKGRGSLVFGAFAAGFGLMVVANLLSLVEIFQLTPEQKLFLFLVPLPVVAAIALARRGRVKRAEARAAEEARRRDAEERASEQRKKADEVRAALNTIGPRLESLERTAGTAQAAPARALLQQAGWAYNAGNLDSARDLALKTSIAINEAELSNQNRKTQNEFMTKRLEAIDANLQALIEQWLKHDPASELGLDPVRIDRVKYDAARKHEDALLQSAQAKQQQAGILLGEGRLSEARDVASAAESELEHIRKDWNAWADLKVRTASVLVDIEKAASWASIDSRAFRRRIDEAKLALAVKDIAVASNAIAAVRAELDALGQTHRPVLGIALSAREYHLNRYEDFHFTVRNEGKAIARRIDVTLEAPADFGPGESALTVKLVSMAPGGAQDCRLNLCFTREGTVPVKFTLAYEDNAGNRIAQEPLRLAANVLGR